MGSITAMAAHDSILILKHREDVYAFSFIDINNGDLLLRWGEIGNGPEEFLSFGSDMEVVDGYLIFEDHLKREINYVPIEGLLSGRRPPQVVKEEYPYTRDFRPFRFSHIHAYKITLGAFTEGRLGLLDSTNTIIPGQTEDPFTYPEVTGLYRGIAFQGAIKSNSKLGRVVVSTYSSDVFEIYQLTNGAIHRTYLSPYQHIPKIQRFAEQYIVDTKNSIAGLMCAAVTEDNIYFTYSGKSQSDEDLNEGASDIILCFDWNGAKVKRYDLPFQINEFCVAGGYIYASWNMGDEIVISRIKL
jgi:hypothetical protein